MFHEILSRLLNTRNERRTLIAVSLCIFIIQIITLRSTVVVGEPYWISYYIQKGFGFVYPYPWDNVLTPTCYIPPLYVYYLLGIFALGGGIVIVQITGLLFFHCANLILYLFFKRYVRPAVLFLGFLAFSIYLPLWLLSEKIDPDALNVLLIATTLFLLDGFRRKVSYKQWLLLGVIYGIQLLVRPDILVGVFFFGFWLFYIIGDKKAFLKGYALSLGIMLLMVSPWTIRNYQVFDRFVLVSSNSGFNLYMGNNPIATGEFQQAQPNAESILMDSARAQYFREHTSSVERDSYLFHVATHWMSEHPWEVIKLDLKKFYYHWWLRESAGSNIQVPLWMISTYNVISLLLAILGLFGLSQLEKRTRWLLISLFAYSTFIGVVFFVQSRHRALKVDPYLIMLSVVAIDRLFSKKQSSLQSIKTHNNA